MKLRQRKTGQGMVHEAWLEIGWMPIARADAPGLGWWFDLPQSPGGEALPVPPRSFRDCMLYKAHWVDASRGYARRFMPAAARITDAVERVLRAPFPAFRVPKLGRRQPLYYFGNALTFAASGTPVRCPDFARALDYELELGAVLRSPLRDATPEQALAAIGGFVVVNDWSLRDIQRAEMGSGFGPQKSKHWLSSMSETMIVAEDVLARVDRLAATVSVNGQVVTRTSTAGMLFGWGDLLAHLSRGETLYPGELIATGTLPGGSGMETGTWLKPGDRLRLEIEDVGALEHEIL